MVQSLHNAYQDTLRIKQCFSLSKNNFQSNYEILLFRHFKNDKTRITKTTVICKSIDKSYGLDRRLIEWCITPLNFIVLNLNARIRSSTAKMQV